MLRLSPEKLHVVFRDNTKAKGPIVPRCYTLTHSDFTGDLFLTIGASYDSKQISGIYTKIMREFRVIFVVSNTKSTTKHIYNTTPRFGVSSSMLNTIKE